MHWLHILSLVLLATSSLSSIQDRDEETVVTENMVDNDLDESNTTTDMKSKRSLSHIPGMEQRPVACIDNSDCTMLGHAYACLLYKCTDYTTHSLSLCTGQADCTTGYQCYHHHLLPFTSGICLLSSFLLPCSSHSDCHAGHGHSHPHCCAGWCCPSEYFRQVLLYFLTHDHLRVQAAQGVLLLHQPAVPGMEDWTVLLC